MLRGALFSLIEEKGFEGLSMEGLVLSRPAAL
jgi:hypothetical protein